MAKKDDTLFIAAPQTRPVTFYIKGITPLIFNAPSQKAKHELLLPKRKTAADRAANLKHDPLAEYRASAYRHKDDTHPTRLFFPCGGWKKAMMTAALETGNASKASIARLMWIEDYNVDIFGTPKLFMAMTRSADINKTPDIRTRAIVDQWCAKLSIRFIIPKLNEQVVGNLLAGAGLMVAIGDWRQEKGSSNHGQFELLPDEAAFNEMAARIGGREQQDAALENPAMFDVDTEEMYTWYVEEVSRREQAGDAAAQNARRKRTQAQVAVNGPAPEEA